MRWPAETNMDFRDGRTRIRLMSQPTIVRLVLQDAIKNMHAFLLFRHAFPNPDLVVEGAKAALTRAARARFPGVARVHERLLSDEEYILNMTVIRVVQSSHLLATYHVTYFTTYLIRRTRRRVISDLNSDNELR
jgi:hypothetical protein